MGGRFLQSDTMAKGESAGCCSCLGRLCALPLELARRKRRQGAELKRPLLSNNQQKDGQTIRQSSADIGNEKQEVDRPEGQQPTETNAAPPARKKRAGSKRRMSAEKMERLAKWEASRKSKLDRNKTVRRLSGEKEVGNWASFTAIEPLGGDGDDS